MQKIFHFFIFLFLGTAMNGQACQLDSIWISAWDHEAQKGILTEKHFFYYHPSGLIAKTIFQVQNEGGIWKDLKINSYDYDDRGNIVKYHLEKFDSQGTFDSAKIGRASFDEYDNVTELGIEVYRNGTDTFRFILTYENLYTDNGLLEQKIGTRWNEEFTQSRKDTLRTYLYDMNENLISETIKKWTPNLELYRCLSEQEFEFEDGLKHTKSFFVYDDDFPLEEKALYIYDDEKRLIKEEVLEFDNEGVESHYAYDYTYNQCDLVEEIISSSRDFITNEWQERGVRKYYYSQVTSIDEIEQSFVFLYPNPVSELLEIEIGGEVGIKKLEVCDMYGRKLMSQDVSSCRFIDVSFLENGNYVLVVNLGDRSYTKPFIKL